MDVGQRHRGKEVLMQTVGFGNGFVGLSNILFQSNGVTEFTLFVRAGAFLTSSPL
jgi:hypothetical protein